LKSTVKHDRIAQLVALRNDEVEVSGCVVRSLVILFRWDIGSPTLSVCSSSNKAPSFAGWSASLPLPSIALGPGNLMS
jgi:hypothetical protein